MQVRAGLPAASKRAELLEALAKHAVLVISGATGCGKSTQVRRRLSPPRRRESAFAQRQPCA